MKAADFVGEFLYRAGVRTVFEVIGGMTTHMIDSLFRQSRIEIVSLHHEQAAAFAADASARITGIPGVAMATSGPGATNLLTGIGSCYFDSTPAVFITGQVNRSEQKGEKPIRQLGFQETSIVEMARPITKGAWMVETPEALPAMLAEAFRLALAGRPGPTLLDVPMDIQRAEIPRPSISTLERQPTAGRTSLDAALVRELLDALDRSAKPLVLVGGGMRAAQAGGLTRTFLEAVQVPAVTSLMALDALPYGHPLRVGFIGSYGNRWANLAIGAADLLLVLGSRLDIRQTGADVEAFRKGKMIYQVDCDEGEMNLRVTGCRAIVADLAAFLTAAIPSAQRAERDGHSGWLAEIEQLRTRWPDTAELQGVAGINPNSLMHEVSRASNNASAFVVDVGNHQMWAAQSLEVGDGQKVITSGGMGAMGFALPAAIGASIALNRAPVVMIAGDGGMQVNLQELQAVVHHRLPIKMMVVNNGAYGMVRQFQQSYLEGRYPSTLWGYSAPDFAAVAKAFGIAAETITHSADLQAALKRMWEDVRLPYLLQVGIETSANAYPKIAFGRPITEMEPHFRPLDVEGT